MITHQDRLIQWLLGSLDLQTTLFHLGQYCGSWQASTAGMAQGGFHVILNGDCWLHLSGTGQKHRLQAGDAVFFLRDLPHLLSPHEDASAAAGSPQPPMQAIDLSAPCSTALACGFFEFRAPINELFLASFPAYVVVSRERDELSEIRPLFDLILAEARSGSAEPSPLLTRLVDLMFFYVVRHLCRRQEVEEGLWAVLARPEFTPLLEAILREPGRDWSVEQMADLTHMSRSKFFRLFSQTAGTSPSQFVAQLRMQLASRWIVEGMPLSRAAEKVGYQSDAAFSRAFKKITGSLPGALRRSVGAGSRLAA